MQTTPDTEVKRVGRFGLVGILNTLIDFGIYNLLLVIGLPRIPANTASTGVAMVFSFLANKKAVFHREGGNLLKQAVIFFVVTAFGLWVLQNGVIKILTEIWTGPVDLAVSIVHILGLDKFFNDDFVINNSAKAAATVVSLTWNYIMYKKVVFRA